MELWDAIGGTQGATITLIGGGGKTSTVFRLAEQAAGRGWTVLVTTTTRMWRPDLPLILAEEAPELSISIQSVLARDHIAVAGERVSGDGKLIGLDPDRLCRLEGMDVTVCEADGAAGRSLKFHRPGEPVVPRCTTHLVVVSGLDAVGRSILESAHPPAFSAEYLGEREDSTIGRTHLERALLEGGGFRPPGARLIFLLNKADGQEQVRIGQQATRALLGAHPDATVLLVSFGHVVDVARDRAGPPSYTRP
jgi:probable selenium-dependent hydroxylase accessory protein YqeC